MNSKDITFYFFPYLLNQEMRIVWVAQQLKKIPTGQSIIDVGAGWGRYKKYCGHLRYTSQDLAQYNGKGDRTGLQTGDWDTSKIDIVSDIVNIPVKNSSYDNVLCTEVLEHVPYPEMAIKEISRILKKKGRLILTAPFASQAHHSPYFFFTGYSKNWYKRILVDSGFKISRIHASGNFFDYLCQEMVRSPIVLRKHSKLGLLSLLLYLFILPLAFIIWVLSKFSTGSEKQLCFGYHVVAIKK